MDRHDSTWAFTTYIVPQQNSFSDHDLGGKNLGIDDDIHFRGVTIYPSKAIQALMYNREVRMILIDGTNLRG